MSTNEKEVVDIENSPEYQAYHSKLKSIERMDGMLIRVEHDLKEAFEELPRLRGALFTICENNGHCYGEEVKEKSWVSCEIYEANSHSARLWGQPSIDVGRYEISVTKICKHCEYKSSRPFNS